MKKILISAAAFALTGTGLAFAGGAVQPMTPAVSGFYVNGNVGYGHVDLDVPNTIPLGGTFVGTVDKNSFAWSAIAGYQFSSYIALEAGYMQLPSAKLTISNATGSVKENFHAFMVAAKGMYPVSSAFSLFAKLGLAIESSSTSGTITIPGVGTIIESSNDDNRIAPLVAIGVDYNVNENIAVSVQGLTTIKVGDAYPASYVGLVGLTYKFV